jgi:high affinity Mn2+ porin
MSIGTRCLVKVAFGILPAMIGMAHIGPSLAADEPAAQAAPAGAAAGETTSPEEAWNLKGQMTAIYQDKPPFHADYTLPGFESLSPNAEHSYSVTSTAYLGVRPWKGAEFYYNEEMVIGVPFSNLNGLASVPNTELQKASGPNPIFYTPRVFLRQTWDLGGDRQSVASGINQLAGTAASNRVVLSVGKMAVVDIFDNNAYAHDGRRDFFNWVNVTYGAFDYAADVRGYTWGAALEYYVDNWAVRAGRFEVPRESNGLELNNSIMNFHGDQVEVEHSHRLAGHSGKLRVLLFRNREFMGRFDDALVYAATHGGTPSVANVRRPDTKHGYGVSLEQMVTDDMGLFARYSWNDGQTETFSYTEVEQSTQAGLSFSGNRWGRAQDTLGIAVVENGLSKAHQAYLAAGGTGFLIGDGRLNYRPEQATEIYYSIPLARTAWFSPDYQHIVHPAYNADRGPVNIVGARLHIEL